MNPNILFTGGSSFSGFWICKTLAESGFNVTAIFQKPSLDDYSGVRKERIKILSHSNLGIQTIFNCSLSSEKTLTTLNEKKNWDFLGLHGAFVTNYKSPDFDFRHALLANTENMKNVFQRFTDKSGHHVISTGTVFEPNEGAGNAPMKAASPYGLSKSLTNEIIRYYSDIFKVKMGKFVLANPFGTYEEEKLTTYLMKSWLTDKTPTMSFPYYIRDNIHVELLAKCYVHFTHQLKNKEESYLKMNPSGYIESQGAFTRRFSDEMRQRLNKDCQVNYTEQTQFTEPYMRVNSDPARFIVPDWNETRAWDQIAQYYSQIYS